MQTSKIEIDDTTARRRYREYLAHRGFETKIDAEIRRTYRAIGQGKVVIKALESIVKAGADELGRPRLAIARADDKRTRCNRWRNGVGRPYRVMFEPVGRFSSREKDRTFSVEMTMPVDPPPLTGGWFPAIEAIVPIVPIFLRPKAKLENYHILWEADWNEVPRDPLLLRHLGEGDLWLVVAQWDLTEVERAALQGRVRLN